jgi:hypothetical protein
MEGREVVTRVAARQSARLVDRDRSATARHDGRAWTVDTVGAGQLGSSGLA